MSAINFASLYLLHHTVIRPIGDALLLGFIVLSIYAILGVRLFAHKFPHADEYFGTYSLAFIGLLGIATGDSWTFEVRKETLHHT